MSERAILAAKHVDAHDINNINLNKIVDETVVYKSIDSVMEKSEVVNFRTEFLNSLDFPGIRPHILNLKIGVPIMILRSIIQPKLCNVTRLDTQNKIFN